MNILVIGPSWVGDMMMSHSLYQILKQQYIGCCIDVLAPSWSKPLLSRMPEVREALTNPFGHGDFALGLRYRYGKSLRNRYDMAIVLPNSLKSALIAQFAKIPVRRGWRGEGRYFLLNDLRLNKQDYPMMVQRYVALGYEKNAVPSSNRLPIPFPYLTVDSSTLHATKKIFEQQLSQSTSRPVIGFCAGAEFGPAKRWPHYHYARLAHLVIEAGFAVHLFGSTKDREIGERIRQDLPKALSPYCVNLAGLTTLEQAVDLIADCQGIVTNDSGLMHVACAVKRPVVALYGPTSPEYTPPLSETAEIIRLIDGGLIKIRQGKDSVEGYHQSLIDIQPERVLESLQRVMSK